MICENPEYWKEKVEYWLFDPITKVFDIKNYRENANIISNAILNYDLYNVAEKKAIKESYTIADTIASGLIRANVTETTLPKYDENKSQSGKVFFDKEHGAEITHPLINKSLKIDLPQVNAASLTEEVKNIIVYDLAEIVRNDGTTDYKKVFNYLFFALRNKLKKDNVGNLGAIWDVIPADTRMPDHPFWNHLCMVSAIGSSIGENMNADKLSLTVFAITPVQDFIGKARKLRDFWTGSIILSYLSFCGIKAVADTLGPDHVVYPSMQNQSLVEEWLKNEYKEENFSKYIEDNFEIESFKKASKEIASFPNKFVFLSSSDDIERMSKIINDKIQEAWNRISSVVMEYLEKKAEVQNKENFEKLWKRTIDNYWKISYGSCKFLELKDEKFLKEILGDDKWLKEFNEVKDFSSENVEACLYGATHSLVQGVLAAGKMKPTQMKNSQYGEKCPLCGEHEILHDLGQNHGLKAADYNRKITEFWGKIRHITNPSDNNYSQTGKSERLCAVCSIKRYLPLSLKDKDDSVLYSVFKNYESFPSTTEMALWKKLEGLSENARKEKANKYHSLETSYAEDEAYEFSNLQDRDKYYAFLLMDGDKMGDLINGESICATWKDVLAPELQKKFETSEFNKNSKLRPYLDKKRSISPAVHAMISDSLNNFARYGVKPIISKYNGKLVYAGGDDVCAILPLDGALPAAEEISKAYTLNFATYKDGVAKEIEKQGTSDLSAIGLHLGTGPKGCKISISGGITIAHHKTPLKEIITGAHSLLDEKAKDDAGRNALAIRLKKRNGGDRDFAFQWNEENEFMKEIKVFDSFQEIIKAVEEGKMGQSLLYKISDFKEIFRTVMLSDTLDNESKKQRLLDLLRYEVSHSGKWDKNTKETEVEQYTKHLAGICLHPSKSNCKIQNGKIIDNGKWFSPEAAIIACFMAADNSTEEN